MYRVIWRLTVPKTMVAISWGDDAKESRTADGLSGKGERVVECQ